MSPRKLFAGFLAATCAALSPVAAHATGGTITGSGKAADPYVVWDADDLTTIATNFNDKGSYSGYVVLSNDIDLAGREWEPIGIRQDSLSPKKKQYYSGTFDGCGHTISNLTITKATWRDTAYTRQSGLFGAISGLTVKNLTMLNANVTAPAADTGVLIGRSQGGANRIENCVVKGCQVTSTTRTALMYGNTMSSASAIIKNSQIVDSFISGTSGLVGGFIGIGQNCNWLVTGCSISNTTVSTAEGNYAGLVCGYVNGREPTIVDQVVENCGSTPLLGTLCDSWEGTPPVYYPVSVRIDGANTKLDVTSIYGKYDDGVENRIRAWTGKYAYAVAAEDRVPGSTLDSAEVEGKKWYTINTSKIVYVATDTELRNLATSVNGGTGYSGMYVLMTNDIALTSDNWTAIGSKSTSKYFYGTFDGDGHTISGLTMTSGAKGSAFIGAGDGAIICNLTLSGVNINLSTVDYVSAFLGINGGNSGKVCVLQNCKVLGNSSIVGKSKVGALSGGPEKGLAVTNCEVSATTVTGTSNVGALIGKGYVGVTCSDVKLYADTAKRMAAFGDINAGATLEISGANTHMEMTALMGAKAGTVQVDAGLYSVAIPTDCLAPQRKNQRETIGETFWYRVVESHEGTGTKNDPYVLEDEDTLIVMATNHAKYAGTYIQMNANITLTKSFATAFGSDATPFGGNFDGNNFSIICGDFVTAGSFFGTVSNLVVKNLSISLTKPLIGKVLEDGTVSVKDTTVGGPASDAVISVNNGTLAFDNVVVTNAASALIANNAGAATVTGTKTDMDVAAICGDGSTGTMQMDNGRFHCTIPADYVAEYYMVESDETAGWYKIVPNKGSGTAEDPWILMCEDDILEFVADMRDAGTKYAASHIKIAKDITMTTAISPTTKQFAGVFDGNGKTIYGLTVTTGLFGDIKGTVKNLTLANGSATSSSAGLLATSVSAGSLIAGCKLVNCTVAGYKNAGAMLGNVTSSVVSNCTVEATTVSFSGQKRGGFIAGHVSGGNIFYGCRVSSCTFSGGEQKGALIGYPDGNLTLVNCVVEDSGSLPIIGVIYSAQTTSTLTIDGVDTSLDVTTLWGASTEGYGTVTIKDGEFSFDPTAYKAANRVVKPFTKGGDDWYRLKTIKMLVIIQ